MEVKFENCDMPLNRESLEKLSEFSNIQLLLIESEREELVDGWKKVKVKTKQIVLLNYHPKAIILAHDLFYESQYQNEKIIGYCPLTFSEEHKPLLRIV